MSSVTEMTGHALRPTRIESVLAAVLLLLALAEAFLSDEQPVPTVIRLLDGGGSARGGGLVEDVARARGRSGARC